MLYFCTNLHVAAATVCKCKFLQTFESFWNIFLFYCSIYLARWACLLKGLYCILQMFRFIFLKLNSSHSISVLQYRSSPNRSSGLDNREATFIRLKWQLCYFVYKFGEIRFSNPKVYNVNEIMCTLGIDLFTLLKLVQLRSLGGDTAMLCYVIYTLDSVMHF